MNYIELGYGDIALASLLLIINAALSLLLGLGMARHLLVAAVRMVVQLTLMGLVLKTLFAMTSPTWTAVAAVLMVLFAGREAGARLGRRFQGLWTYGLGTSSMLMAGGVITVLALTSLLRPDPWYDPRYALPLLGMILGNTMNAVALGLNTLTAAAYSERNAIEARLALGHTRFEALDRVMRQSMRTAMMPIVNAMAATGLISLPGMMTGQILAGVDPVEAVKYQLLIMFLIAGGTALGGMMAVLGGAWRLTDERHRLRLDRLTGGAG